MSTTKLVLYELCEQREVLVGATQLKLAIYLAGGTYNRPKCCLSFCLTKNCVKKTLYGDIIVGGWHHDPFKVWRTWRANAKLLSKHSDRGELPQVQTSRKYKLDGGEHLRTPSKHHSRACGPKSDDS